MTVRRRRRRVTPGHVVRAERGPAKRKKVTKAQKKKKQRESARRGGGSAGSASSTLGLNALTQMARGGDIDWSSVQLSGHKPKKKVKRLPKKRRMATKKSQLTKSEALHQSSEFSGGISSGVRDLGRTALIAGAAKLASGGLKAPNREWAENRGGTKSGSGVLTSLSKTAGTASQPRHPRRRGKRSAVRSRMRATAPKVRRVR